MRKFTELAQTAPVLGKAILGTIPPPILARYPRDNNSGVWHSGRVILSRKCGGKK